MIKLTEKSSQQIIKLLKTEAPLAKLRMRVVGGGCSGLSYKLEFDANTPAANDKIYEDFGISIIVDSKSDFYLDKALSFIIQNLKDLAAVVVPFLYNSPCRFRHRLKVIFIIF
jgi:iron-sulfur cluster assembly protein